MIMVSNQYSGTAGVFFKMADIKLTPHSVSKNIFSKYIMLYIFGKQILCWVTFSKDLKVCNEQFLRYGYTSIHYFFNIRMLSLFAKGQYFYIYLEVKALEFQEYS